MRFSCLLRQSRFLRFVHRQALDDLEAVVKAFFGVFTPFFGLLFRVELDDSQL